MHRCHGFADVSTHVIGYVFRLVSLVTGFLGIGNVLFVVGPSFGSYWALRVFVSSGVQSVELGVLIGVSHTLQLRYFRLVSTASRYSCLTSVFPRYVLIRMPISLYRVIRIIRWGFILQDQADGSLLGVMNSLALGYGSFAELSVVRVVFLVQ